MQFAVRLKPLNRGDLASRDCARMHLARARRASIDQHGARAALSFATAVFCAGEIQPIAQDVEQHFVLGGGNAVLGAVDVQSDLSHGRPPGTLSRRSAANAQLESSKAVQQSTVYENLPSGPKGRKKRSPVA